MSHQITNASECSVSLRFSRNLRITDYGNQSASCNREKSSGGVDLPLELLELILAYLPALKIMELKQVCRTWRLLLQSAKFKERWITVRGGCSHETLDLWVMKSSEGPSIAYIPAFKKHYWFLPLLFSPAVLESPPTAITPIENLLEKSSFLGVDGPLIVFESAKTRRTSLHCIRRISLCSYNTVTGQKAHLPVLQLEGCHRILQGSLPTVIVMDRNRQGYHIVVETCMDGRCSNFSCAQERQRSQLSSYALRVYSSTANTWTLYVNRFARNDINADIFSGLVYHYDHVNKNLYLWYPDRQLERVRVTFPIAYNSYTQFAGTTETNAFKVVKCRNNVLMVTSMVRREGRSMEQGFSVWKLTRNIRPEHGNFMWYASWIEISRTPADLYLKGFREESFLHPTFIVDGGRICIMASSAEYMPMLIYDVDQDSWYHQPELVKNMEALLAMKVSFTVSVKE